MLEHIEVKYEVYSTAYSIRKALKELSKHKILSFDTETQSIYSKEEKLEAKELLKVPELMEVNDIKLCKLVANSSGLSFPGIVKIPHFIFGLSEDESVILIANDKKVETLICNWIVEQDLTFITHNAGFDLKLVYNRTGKFPKHFEDSQMLAKCLINHTENWKAKVGLKELMGSYYDPKWSMIETYDIEDYKDKDFLRYCSIDGASTFKLWELLNEAT